MKKNISFGFDIKKTDIVHKSLFTFLVIISVIFNLSSQRSNSNYSYCGVNFTESVNQYFETPIGFDIRTLDPTEQYRMRKRVNETTQNFTIGSDGQLKYTTIQGPSTDYFDDWMSIPKTISMSKDSIEIVFKSNATTPEKKIKRELTDVEKSEFTNLTNSVGIKGTSEPCPMSTTDIRNFIQQGNRLPDHTSIRFNNDNTYTKINTLNGNETYYDPNNLVVKESENKVGDCFNDVLVQQLEVINNKCFVNLNKKTKIINLSNGIEAKKITIKQFSNRTITTCNNGVSLRENRGEDEIISVYPNPASDFLLVNISSESKEIKLDIIDFDGRIIKTITLSNPNGDNKINIVDLNPGFYAISIISESQKIVKKFVKM